jgi:hypothetical protein
VNFSSSIFSFLEKSKLRYQRNLQCPKTCEFAVANKTA